MVRRKLKSEGEFSRFFRWSLFTGKGPWGILGPGLVPKKKEEGLFVLPTRGVSSPFLYLSSLIIELAMGGRLVRLCGPERLSGGTVPLGPVSCRGYPFPDATWRDESFRVRLTLFPVPGEMSIALRLRLLLREEGILRVRPVFGFRSIYDLNREREIPLGVRREESGIFLRYGAEPVPPFVVAAPGFEFSGEFSWVRGIRYPVDEERGEGAVEDLPTPGYLAAKLSKGPTTLYLLFSTEKKWEDAISEKPGPLLRRIRGTLKRGRPLTSDLPRIFQKDFNPVKESLIRGFSAVDSAVSGVTGLPSATVNVYDLVSALNDALVPLGLEYFADGLIRFLTRFLRKGLLPKYLDGEGNPVYGAADVSLLFVDAVGRLIPGASSRSELERLYPVVKEIVYSFMEGTDYRIRMDDDSLISAGEEGVESTWMDRVRGSRHICPRFGKAVDVNALWYSALCVLRDLALTVGEKKVVQEMVRLIPRVKSSFLRKFVLEKEGYLADLVRGDEVDRRVRPNQLFALASVYPVLSPTFGRRVLQRVKEHLLTDLGLRTLSYADPSYRGRVEGTEEERVEAILNGGVVPRFALTHARALFAVHGRSVRARNIVKRTLIAQRNMADLVVPCFLPEAVSGDPPHLPAGDLVSLSSTAALVGLFHLYRLAEEGREL